MATSCTPEIKKIRILIFLMSKIHTLGIPISLSTLVDCSEYHGDLLINVKHQLQNLLNQSHPIITSNSYYFYSKLNGHNWHNQQWINWTDCRLTLVYTNWLMCIMIYKVNMVKQYIKGTLASNRLGSKCKARRSKVRWTLMKQKLAKIFCGSGNVVQQILPR